MWLKIIISLSWALISFLFPFLHFSDAPPPIATVVGGSPVEVLFGQNLTVVCRVETPFVAENGTRIEWRRETDSNGLPCPPGPHAQQRRHTTANPEVQEQYLDLLSFQDADAGNYSCNASNVGGESSTSVLIRAACKCSLLVAIFSFLLIFFTKINYSVYLAWQSTR